MTKREREQIHKAMDLMWNQDDTMGALAILKRLVGQDTSLIEAIQMAPSVSLQEVCKKPVSVVHLNPVVAVNSIGEPVTVENNEPFTKGCNSGCCWGLDGRFHHHPYCKTYGMASQ